MYCNFFGLRCRPFDDRAETRFLHATADCEEALAAMEYEARCAKGMTLLLGDAGMGKTLLIRSLLQRLDASHRVVVLTWPATGQMNLIRETAKGFGVSLPSADHDARCLTRLRRHLTRRAKANSRAITIIDQAEYLTSENMTQLAAMSDMRHGGARLLSIILVAQPHIRALLDRSESARISQQLYGEWVLPPLTREETGQYVQHRLRTAGAADAHIFDEEAVTLIHEAAGGVPRLINHICDAAMLAAYGAGVSGISREMAAEVTRTTGPRERAIETREVGIDTADQVAAGLTGTGRPHGPTGQVVAGLSDGTQPFAAAEQTPPEATTADTRGMTGHSRETLATVNTTEGGGQGITDLPVTGSTLDQPTAGRGFDGIAPTLDRQEAPYLPAESLSTSHEGLLRRLEGALARADRMTDTTEASIARFTAVEEHLSSLSTGAEQLIRSLAGTVQKATQSIDTVQRRLDEILARAEDRTHAVEAQMSQMAEVSNGIDEQVQRSEHTCEHADEVESRLKSMAEQLADKADEVQERITLLMSRLGSGDEAQSRLTGLLQEASSVTAEAHETIRTLQLTSQQAVEKGEQFRDQFIDKALKTYRAEAQRQIEDYERLGLERIETAKRKLDGVVEQASSLTSQVDNRIDALRTTLVNTRDEADRLRERLTDSMLRDSREKIQEQLQHWEKSAHKTVETAQSELDGLSRQASSLAADAEERIMHSRSVLAETKAEAERLQEEFSANALHKCRKEREEQLEIYLREQRGVVETALSEHRAKLQEMIDLSDSQVRNVDEASTLMRRQVDEMLEVISSKIDRHRQELETLQQREDEVGSSLAAITDGLVGASAKTTELTETVTGFEVSIARLTGRAETAQAGLTNLMPQAERLLGDVHGACGQIEAGQRTVGTMLAEVGGACERVQALREYATQCQNIVTQLTSGRTEGEITTRQLEETIASARSLLEAVQQAVKDADGECGRLDSQRTSMTELADTLSQANVTGRTTIEQLNESACKAEKASEDAVGHLTRLTGAQRASADAAGRLDELVTTANQLHEAMQGLVAHADEKIGRINSHCAAATSVMRNLSETNVSSTRVLETVNESKDRFELMVENAKKHMGQLLQDVSSLTARTQINAKELEARRTAAVELIDRLNAAAAPAEEAATQLTKCVDQAKEHLSSMAEQSRQAGDLTERLGAIMDLVPSAKEAEASIEKATEQARCTHDQLVVSADTARHQEITLQELNDSAYGLIETHEQLKREAETSAERLSAQMTATEKMLETAKPLLDKFVGRARGLREKLRDLEDNAVRIERSLDSATARPMEIVASAQAEAAQLERVCATVRQVFTGLSQASLEAKRRTAECGQTTQQTARRLSQLTTETDRAANTLNQWVEEALRAQSRLEKTLDNCPSIRETHPGNAIQRMSRITGPAGRIADASAIGELEMLSEPGATEPSPQEGTAKPPARADEISQLIEDAKQAVAEAKG